MLGIEKKITKEMYAKEIVKAVKTLGYKETKRVVCNAVQDVADYSFEKAWNFASDIACNDAATVAKRTKKDVLISVLKLIKVRLGEADKIHETLVAITEKQEAHEADSMTGDEVIEKVMEVYESNKEIIEVQEDKYEILHVWDNGKYYPVEAVVLKRTDYSIRFRTKRGAIKTEPLNKIRMGVTVDGLTYSKPKKNYKGLWEVTITNDIGHEVQIREWVRKAAMDGFLKERGVKF